MVMIDWPASAEWTWRDGPRSVEGAPESEAENEATELLPNSRPLFAAGVAGPPDPPPCLPCSLFSISFSLSEYGDLVILVCIFMDL